MESDAESALPPGLDLLWGKRQRGRKGPKPGLTLESIVEQAIAVADAEGLAAVSMARVAKDLGFTTMSLYRYVGNKDELLQLMWNASASGAPEIEGADWRTFLWAWALEQRAMLRRRRWILEMPIVTPPAGPNSLAWIEQAIAALDGTGLSMGERMGVVAAVSSYTMGEARMAYDVTAAQARGEPTYDYAAVLREVADEDAYPHLYRVAWSGEIDDADGANDDESFQFGLGLILDGVAARIAAASS